MSLKQLRLPLLLLSTAAILNGCSAEWRAANDECRRLAYNKYPPAYEKRSVQRSKSVKVPDGNYSCTTGPTYGGYTDTNCTQGTKRETRYYQEVISVDVNKGLRSDYQSSCRANTCMQRYGNTSCTVAAAPTTQATFSPKPTRKGLADILPAKGLTWFTSVYQPWTPPPQARFKASAFAIDRSGLFALGSGWSPASRAQAIRAAITRCEMDRTKTGMSTACQALEVNGEFIWHGSKAR